MGAVRAEGTRAGPEITGHRRPGDGVAERAELPLQPLQHGGGGLEAQRASCERVASAIANAIPDLWGYVGVDFVDTDEGPVVLEINPRLTTSYLGYRALTQDNLAERILVPAGRRKHKPIDWTAGGSIAFSLAGHSR